MFSKIYFSFMALLMASCSFVTAQDFPYYLTIDEQSYNDIEGGTNLVQDYWDDPFFTVPIGFEFEFYGSPVTELYQNDLGSTLFNVDDFNSDDVDILFVYGSDIIDLGYLNDTLISIISYVTEGAPGSRICKIEWNNVGFYTQYSDGGPMDATVNFQLWLYEGSNTMEIRFGPNTIPEDDSDLHDYNGNPFIGGFIDYDFNTDLFETLWYFEGEEDVVEVTTDSTLNNYNNASFIENNPIEGRVYRFTTAPFVNTNEPDLRQFVNIFPSLATDFTQVEIKQQNFSQASIQVFNQLGQIILQQDAHVGIQQVDLTRFSAGTYFVRVLIDDGSHSEVIVKQ